MSKKLDKRTLKWAAREIGKWAGEAHALAGPRIFDSTAMASRLECAARENMIRLLARKIRKGKK